MTNESRTAYQERMRESQQFQFFGIQPIWRPDEKDIDGFIHDEVVRQFHDTRVEEDGGVRIRGMRAAWDHALARYPEPPDAVDIPYLASCIEPKVNLYGYRTDNVWIGGKTAFPPPFVGGSVRILLDKAPGVRRTQGREGPHPDEYRARFSEFEQMAQGIVTADDWYLAFEAIHPFGDGNGRTGKILHNWLLGTLEDPVLIADYFGYGNP